MPFAYYDRLTRPKQRIYRESDSVTGIPLPTAQALRPLVGELSGTLTLGDRLRTQTAAQTLVASLTAELNVPPVRVEVLAVRPARSWGELHGLYMPSGGGRPARVTLWMRTARQKRIVVFRTFLRTLLHELCHHLDYERLGLADSFHTEGFYKRESSLLQQLVGDHRRERPHAREVAELPFPMR